MDDREGSYLSTKEAYDEEATTTATSEARKTMKESESEFQQQPFLCPDDDDETVAAAVAGFIGHPPDQRERTVQSLKSKGEHAGNALSRSCCDGSGGGGAGCVCVSRVYAKYLGQTSGVRRPDERSAIERGNVLDLIRAEVGGWRVSHVMERMSVSTAFDGTSAAWLEAAGADAPRVKMMTMQTTMRAVLENFVVELFGRHIAVIIRQVVLRELGSMLDPAAFAFVSEKRELDGIISLGLRGCGETATSANCADVSEKKRCEHALVSADTFMVQEDVEPSKDENGDLIVVDSTVCNEWKASLLDETPQAARVLGTGAIKKATDGNEPTSNDSSPEKGSTHQTNGTADWVLTAAKGKEQDDDDEDDDDDDDDGDDDDYEEEEEDDNDNKLEPGEEEEDVEGEDEEGEEEAGEEDGEDDGEAEDNGENDDGEEEEGEEEDDVEGDEDGDEDGDEEQEEDEEDGEEEDPEDEDEDEVEGESEEDIEDLEPPKKKRK
ncbi:unnamed protein product [Calypogeia fissa]